MIRRSRLTFATDSVCASEAAHDRKNSRSSHSSTLVVFGAGFEAKQVELASEIDGHPCAKSLFEFGSSARRQPAAESSEYGFDGEEDVGILLDAECRNQIEKARYWDAIGPRERPLMADESDPLLRLGIGLEGYITEKLPLFAELDYRLPEGDSDDLQFMTLQFGALFRF